jgi:hypothetical protein
VPQTSTAISRCLATTRTESAVRLPYKFEKAARSQKIQARCGRSGKFVKLHKAPDSTRTGLEVIDLLAISSTRRWASWLYSWNMIVDSINQVFPATMAGTGPPSGAK